ncbi:MAG: hypothetical protein WD512_13660 [Candidatus Paceibacterota bacterium]
MTNARIVDNRKSWFKQELTRLYGPSWVSVLREILDFYHSEIPMGKHRNINIRDMKR